MAVHLVAGCTHILVIGALLVADALRLDLGNDLGGYGKGLQRCFVRIIALPFSLFTLPFLGSSHRLLLFHLDSKRNSLGIVVEVFIVGNGTDAAYVLALTIGG